MGHMSFFNDMRYFSHVGSFTSLFNGKHEVIVGS